MRREKSSTKLRNISALLMAVVGSLGAFLLGTGSVVAQVRANTVLFDFESADEPGWSVVNDGVMGGVSTSKVRIKDGALLFSGRVRLENNGGFASTRSTGVPLRSDGAFAKASTVVLRARGDNRIYRITLDTPTGWYWATVRASKSWTTREIPYSKFEPHTRFGEIRNSAAFDGRPVSRIGVLVYNKKAERFSMEIDFIALR